MKKLRDFLAVLILGGILGWLLGFLRLPLTERNYTFWAGLMVGLVLVSIVISLLFLWNKRSALNRLIGKDPESSTTPPNSRTYLRIWMVVTLLIVAGGLGVGFMMYRKSQLFATQLHEQNEHIREQSEIIESFRNSGQVSLMSHVLEKVDLELNQNPNGKLSEGTIARIVALSSSFKPYRYYTGDRLSEKKLSPERGQLLLALSAMKIDSASFAQIKRRVSFTEADLQGADLNGINLSGIDLTEANLRDVNLEKTNLKEAILNKANLWGANLYAANLSNTILENADMRWANLNSVELSAAILNGADLTGTKLRRANLREAFFKWAKLDNAILNNADLTGADFFSASLVKASLNHAKLYTSRLRNADMSEANLTGAEIVKVAVGKNWLEKLGDWRISGAENIPGQYEIVEDTCSLFLSDKYYLKKIQ